MPERKLDEDDDNWVLANRGRGTGRSRIPSERRTAKPRQQSTPPGYNHALAAQSREDVRQAFIRQGRVPPGEEEPEDEEPVEDEGPDDWRDDWRDTRMRFPRR